MGEFIGLVATILIFGIPIVAIWTGHQRKMLELKMRAGAQADTNVLSQLRDIRNQLTELRDTTTRYDVSFDAALQRIESRVGSLEGRVHDVEQRVRRLDGETVPAARG